MTRGYMAWSADDLIVGSARIDELSATENSDGAGLSS